MGTSGPCHRCGRAGHLARDCSLHTCFRCNGRGHMAWECVEGVTCSKCGEKGHLQRNCKSVSCHKCGRKGHISKFCNDPFAKAAEVERSERQQALLVTKVPRPDFAIPETTFDKGESTIASNYTKAIPGPWDGLGVTSRDGGLTESVVERAEKTAGSTTGYISPAVSAKKRPASNMIQSVVSQRLKIVAAKQNQRQNNGATSLQETDEIVPAVEAEGASGLQWKGLVGYESEGSDDKS